MDVSIEKQVSRGKIGMNTADNTLMNLISKGRNTILQFENRESKTERNLKLSKESTLQKLQIHLRIVVVLTVALKNKINHKTNSSQRI